MKQRSLEAVVADMARRFEIFDRQEFSRPEAPGEWGAAFQALLSSDSILASLYKEYLESRARLEKLSGCYGAQDAMSVVASDMLDSARSAMQTRLMELQAGFQGDSEAGAAQAVFVQNCRRLAARKAQEEHRQKRLRREKRGREAERESELFFWILMLSWIMNHTVCATRRTLSAARDFSLVSPDFERKAAYSA